jgi:dihydroxyacid dehydratase/phosphogluconate dehydratase
VQLAAVLRKKSRDLLADECSRQVRNFQATIDRIVIGNCDVIHPAFAQLFIQLFWIGIAVGKIEAAKKPFF